MAPGRKGSGHQAKHYQPQDHAHAAHQEEASRGQPQKPGRGDKTGGKSAPPKTGHPVELTPKGARKGQ
jgi:hypothetical protein